MQSKIKNLGTELLFATGAGFLVALIWKITGLYDKYPYFMYYVVGAVAAVVGIKVRAKNKNT